MAAPSAGGRIAQLVEQLTLNQPVLGSNPSAPPTNTPAGHSFADGRDVPDFLFPATMMIAPLRINPHWDLV